MKQFLFITTLYLNLTSAYAGSVAGFGGSTEITQLANNIELVSQSAQQAEQLATQIQMYQNMIKNTTSLPTQIWSKAQQDLQSVMKVVQQGQALAFSANNIGYQFTKAFPGFKLSTHFITDYKNWSATTMDSIRGALQAANLMSEQFTTEEDVLAQLRDMSTSSDGQVKALQVGNQIAVEQASQLQKLRALMMTQMQAQNTYLAAQQQEKDATNAAVDSFFNVTPIDGNTYKGFKGGTLQ